MKVRVSIIFLVIFLLIVSLALIGCGGGRSKTSTPSPSPSVNPSPSPGEFPFNLPLLPDETSQLAVENFNTNSSAFFADYAANWGLENASAGDFTTNVTANVFSITSTASKTAHIHNKYALSTAAYSVNAFVKAPDTGSAGVLARWIDKNNFYTMRIKGDGTLDLGNSKISGTVLSTINTNNSLGLTLTAPIPDFNLNNWYKVSMIVRNIGSNVEIAGYVNNDRLLYVTIPNSVAQITGVGSCGLYSTINSRTALFQRFSSYNVTATPVSPTGSPTPSLVPSPTPSVTPEPSTLPGPTIAVDAANGQVRVRITPVTGATGYKLFYSRTDTPESSTQFPGIVTGTTTITGLTNETSYNFWGITVNNQGDGDPGNIVSATPMAPDENPNNFDNLPTGAFSRPIAYKVWFTGSAGGAIPTVTTAQSSSPSNSIMLQDNDGNSAPNLRFNNGENIIKGRVNLKIFVPSSVTKDTMITTYFYDNANTGVNSQFSSTNYVWEVRFAGSGKLRYRNTSGSTVDLPGSPTYTKDTWHNVEVSWDFSLSQTIILKVDDTTFSDIPLATASAAGLNRIEFKYADNNTSGQLTGPCIDDAEITAITTSGTIFGLTKRR